MLAAGSRGILVMDCAGHARGACQSCSQGMPGMLAGVCQSWTMPVMLAGMPVMLAGACQSRRSMLCMLPACLNHDHAHEHDTSMIMPLDLGMPA